MTGTIKITTAGREPITIAVLHFTDTDELKSIMQDCCDNRIVTVRFDLIECIEDKLNEMEGEYDTF